MSAHSDEVETKLQWSLATVARAIGADRSSAYRAESDSSGSTLVLTLGWTAAGVEPNVERARVLGPEGSPWLFERL